MNIPFGHHQLKNRYRFEGELEPVTALRISSGRASDVTDAPFITTFNGIPYIPGSSLRGAIRAEVERILAEVGEASGLTSCILFEKDGCADKVKDFLHELEKEEGRRKNREERTKDERIAEFAEGNLCDVCKLFGSSVYASRLMIEDALPRPILSGGASQQEEGKAFDSRHIRVRDGVGIDRDTGAARDGVKFDYEVIEPSNDGPFFRFRMEAENVTDREKRLLNLILSLLRLGLHVGGKRTGGLGIIKLKEMQGANGKSFYRVTGFEDSESLWKRLTTGKNILQPITDWKEEIGAEA
jgi:CRISPR-associated RAMP protein (TIGR02581 family)